MKIYVKKKSGKTVPLEVESTDFIYNVQTKIQVKERIPRGHLELKFLEEYLEEGRTLADYGIRENSTLQLVALLCASSLSEVKISTHFVDLENKGALQRIAFTHGRGQRWCRVISGLNIEGKCTHKECAAYAKRVISPKGLCALDITRESSTCPECEYTIEASTCGFTDCEWMYSGRKRESAVEITSEWHVAGDQYERFREVGNMTGWEVLIITAWPSRSPRPECVMCLRTMLWREDHESLECGCRFHKHCVASWKLYETHCPTCSVEICRPNNSTEGREGMPYISVEGRAVRPNISMIGRRPKRRSRFWRLLTWLNLVSD